MDAHNGPHWESRGGPLTRDSWPTHQQRIEKGMLEIFGRPPAEKVPLDPKVIGEEDCGSYIRRKISIQVEADDRMPFYLLIPKAARAGARALLPSQHGKPVILRYSEGSSWNGESAELTANARSFGVPQDDSSGPFGEWCELSFPKRAISFCNGTRSARTAFLAAPTRAPAIICFYGTTGGTGKLTTVGLAGNKPGDPPVKNRGFAVDMAEAGFVAVAADYLRDGERVSPGRKPYDTTDFYKKHPDWSIHGKDAWDTSRLIDYLQTLDFIDHQKIGMVGHSYGGHSTIFTTAMEPRIKCAVANGPVSDFIHHGMHRAMPKGGSGSQSLPAMRPYVLDPTLRPPITFYEVTAMIAPRPLLIGQAVGERRPMEEENHAAVADVYRAIGEAEKCRYVWYSGDHDFPPQMRKLAVGWFRKWL
jgi:hypothetical protein